MRILALDLGEKRIGVALSDALGLTAQGLEVISYTRPEQALSRLEEICREYLVERIVVGLPLNMDGSRGEAARRAEAFAAKIRQALGLPVSFLDERLSTAAAEKTLLEADVSRRKRKQVRDKLAAVLILEAYLEARRREG